MRMSPVDSNSPVLQARIYNTTRTWFLHGREDMLALVAAQMLHKARTTHNGKKPVWIDVGGGTGWNIEAMAKYLNVPAFFEKVYLVDFSPSLLAVAHERFERLGWDNVEIVCKDALEFCLGRSGVLSRTRKQSRPSHPFVQSQYTAELPCDVRLICGRSR